MKKFIITEEEKRRILNMHNKKSGRLLEQDSCVPAPQMMDLSSLVDNGYGGPINQYMTQNGYAPGSSNYIPVAPGTYTLVNAGTVNNASGLAYLVDSKNCWTGYVVRVNDTTGEELSKVTLTIDEEKYITLSSDGWTIDFSYKKNGINYPEENIEGVR
jgi:hypothetical protein